MANRLILLSIISFLSLPAMAQETTVSPYSVFGIGDIQLGESGRTVGMSATGLGLSGGRLLNITNPASLASLDSLTFLFDVSGSAKYAKFTTGSTTQNAFGANFTKITAGLHISKVWSAAISLQPYSIVSYKVEREGYIEGSQVKVNTLFEGTGGITRFSFLNSVRLSRNFSVGADVMLLFGNIQRTTSQNTVTLNELSATTSASFNAGLQYRGSLSTSLVMGAGFVYGYRSVFDFENNLTVRNEANTVIFEDRLASSRFSAPQSFAFGLSFMTQRFIFNTDYRFHQWSSVNNRGSNLTFTDTHKFDAGIAFTPAKGAIKSYFELIQYQGGFSVSNSFFTLAGVNPVNYEISLGAGLPFRGGSQVTVAAAYGKKGSLKEGLIREDYFRFSLSLSISEMWFMKRLYQ